MCILDIVLGVHGLNLSPFMTSEDEGRSSVGNFKISSNGNHVTMGKFKTKELVKADIFCLESAAFKECRVLWDSRPKISSCNACLPYRKFNNFVFN
jgi:hypothetical protein